MSVKLPISFKLVAVLLSVTVLLVSLPLSAMASGNPESSAVSEEPDSLHASEAESADGTTRVLYELTQFRDADTKRFRQSDGTVRVVQYGEPVHYLDASGAWQDMDNTLISSEDVFSTADSRVRFAKTVTESSPLLSFNSGRHAVRVFLTGSLSRSVGTVSASGRSGSPDDTDTIDIEKIPARIPSEIRYESITGHTDLSYTVTGSSVKETIVVKAPCDSYSYSFLLDLDHLEAAVLEDGTVRLSDPDTEETVFVIPAGFMTDAAGEESAQVSYTLAKTGDGRYMLTVEADAGWIQDPSRSFPISIDPSFYATYSSMQDLYVSEVFPNTSYSSTTSIIVNESTGHSRIGYWKTDDLPPLPASACITEATLSLYSSSVGGSYVGAYAAVSSWGNTLTWNKTVSSVPEGALSASLLDYACVDGSPSDSRYVFDLTGLVRSWYNETAANYGIGLKTVPGTASSGSVSFRSSDYSVSSARPLFTVVYKDMKGVEPYWSVSAQDLGLAGTGYVNLATGALTVVKPLLSTTDYLFPYTPTVTYHSTMAGKAWVYPDAENSFDTSYMPYGFRLNITETVIRKQYGLPDGTSADYYIWSDADGTEHAFYGIGDSGTEFQDEDGLQLRLTIGTGQCTLTDDAKTVKTFSRMTDTPDTQVLDAYFLSSVRDRNQNTVSFSFSTNYRPVSVTMKPNGFINPIYFLTIAYTSYGLPYLIWNQSTKEAIVFRYSSTPTGSISAADPHYLRELVHAHGSAGLTASDWDSFYADETYTTHITVDGKASYSYDSNGFLISCKDHLSDSEIRYTVSGGKIGTAQEYSGSYAGQKIGFTYWSGYTDVRTGGTDDAYYTSDDLITRYTFDKEGRTAGVWSTDAGGTQVYGASASEYETADRVRNNLKSRTVVGGSPANYLLNGGFERVNSDSDALYWNETANVRFNSAPAEEDGGNRRAYFPGQNGVTDSITQYVRLPEGTYTLSMSVHTYHCENMDVQVRARSLSDPLRDFAEDVPVNDFYASGGAQPFSMTFTAEDDNSGFEYFEISILVTGGYIGASGEVSVGIDNVMLEESIGSSRYSMVEMGNFEMASLNASGTAYAEHGTDFWLDQSNTLVRASASAPFGYAGQVTGSIAEERYLRQRVYTAPASVLSDYDELYATTPVTTYLISGFAKGTGQVHSPHGIFALRVDITYYNGSGNADTVVSSLFRFQNDCSDWQFVTGSVRTEEYRCVKAVDVLCVFAYQPGGCALFDDIAFSVNDDDSVVRYGYYDSGDQNGLLHVKETGWYTEVYEYNSDRQLVRVANNRGELHDYAYAANGADVSSDTYFTFTPKTYPYLSSDPDSHITKTPKLRTTYTYNNYGQPTGTSCCEVEYDGSGNVVDRTGTGYVTSSNQYETTAGSKIFGALTAETDTLGRQTRYYYDSVKGYLLAAVNTGSGTGTCYYYDSIGNLEDVFPCSYGASYSPVYGCESVFYSYDSRNRLESIETDSTRYRFTYDVYGNRSSVAIGTDTLAQYAYQNNDGKLYTVTYGNGFRVRYVYDELERIREIWHRQGTDPEVRAYVYTYTTDGQIHRVDDLLTGKSTTYKYNASGKLVGLTESDNSTDRIDFGENIFYNDKGQVSSVFENADYTYGNVFRDQWTVQYFHAYKTDGKLNYYTVATETTTGRIDYQYDAFGRLDEKTYSFHLRSDSSQVYANTVGYTFTPNGNNTSAQIRTFTSQVGNNAAVTWTYSYDGNGNITKATASNGTEYRYVYDKLGQLIREDNTSSGRTYVYAYDDAGNIQYKKTYALTAANSTPNTLYSTYNYSYGDADWGDLLTSYRGTTITYDSIGNPLSYYNGSSYTFTWEQGRRLKTASKGSYSLSFGYNDEGIRVSKTVNGVEHRYTLSGTRIVSEEWGTSLCIYLYDESGSPIGMQYRTASMAEGVFYTFWFEKDLQGDIVAIYNSSGTKVFSYTYDAWGNFTMYWINSSGTNYYASYNPFTYHGYYFDSETGLYYVSSRYYDPEICRWINADDTSYLGASGDFISYNLFAYCGNNPVTGYDPDGTLDWGNLFKGIGWLAVGVTAIAVGVSVLTCGVAAPAMMAVAAVTVAAGAATVVNGVSELGEVATGHNFMRDDVFRGNANAYNTYAHMTATVAVIGTMVCGGWLKANSPRIKAYKSMDTYNVKGKHLSSGNGNWSKFNTTSQAELRTLGKEAIKNSPMGSLYPNSADSYRLIYDYGRVIGTSGETSARLIFSNAGKIITFFPQ